jgi:hypothetical protein
MKYFPLSGMKIFNTISGIAGIFFLVILNNCETYRGITVDCDECYFNEPDSGDLIVYVTINSENTKVPLIIYKDQVDDERIEYVDTAFSSPYYLWVDLNEYYSVKAEYRKGDQIIYAIDGDKIKSRFVTETCEFDCYVVADGVINVELKDE